MNGTLPGLLDDPNITLSLPVLNDVHIAPLRNPAPSRYGQAPLPLELIDSNHVNENDRSNPTNSPYDDDHRARSAQSAPAEPPSARDRDMKKPHLAISELVDAPPDPENGQVQLPSFVSLSVVEKSPTQQQLNLSAGFPNKRPRLETDTDQSQHDVNRLLPRPIQKDDKHVRPLLPAMVTGLHEPPPSAALLPSMDLDNRPALHRSATTPSKMQVKDMLLETHRPPHGRPPEQMLNTPEVANAELPKAIDLDPPYPEVDSPSTTPSVTTAVHRVRRDQKVRRTRRKWTQAETDDLLAGVKKHGFGKWKQILNDPSYTFIDRTSIDLKDRFRVFAKDYPDTHPEPLNDEDIQHDARDGGTDSPSSKSTTGGGQHQKPRRKRHPWTHEEDQALLQGVQKHGFQWTDIHNDPELALGHRRATDLRDRIRNLYPDGYKHAEARPLRAEVKKAEKAGKKETPAGTLYAPPGQMEAMNFSSTARSATVDGSPRPRNTARRQTTSGRVPSIAALTSHADDGDTSRPSAPRRSKTVESDQAGITLPSLALDSGNDTDAWDNTLPPFINWEV